MADIFMRLLKPLTKWKPGWLFVAMPFACWVAGFAAIYHFDTPAGYVAGALLLIVASLIWAKQAENRAKNVTSTDNSQTPSLPDR